MPDTGNSRRELEQECRTGRVRNPLVVAADLPRELPEGRARIEGWENWLFCEAAGAPPSYTRVHPGYAFVACARNSAVSLTELLAMVGTSPDDGPMVLSSETEFKEQLEVDVDYRVLARIVSLESKTGQRIGPFDLLTHELSLVKESGEVVVTYTGMMALPRNRS